MPHSHEPIDITTGMMEPKDDGLYLLTERTGAVSTIDHELGVWYSAGIAYLWAELLREISGYGQWLQSLADHDAQIRLDALKLDADEMRTMCAGMYAGDLLKPLDLAVKAGLNAVTARRENRDGA
jgi:hypothetical protein